MSAVYFVSGGSEAVESCIKLARQWAVRACSFEALLRLRGSADPTELMAELEERWTTQIAAAEYVPFKRRPDDDDDDD